MQAVLIPPDTTVPGGGPGSNLERKPSPMARKTVKVTQPGNIDDTVLTFEKIVQRNDGVLPAVPQSTIYITLGALVGLSVPAVASGPTGSPPTPPPGTHKVPEDIAAPMRALYPSLKRN